MEEKILKWIPEWYELDWNIIVGDIDLFTLKGDCFLNGFMREEEASDTVRLKILSITHPVLGALKGIVAIGLDYTVYLSDGRILTVNAEEEPGHIYDTSLVIDDWTCEVKASILEEGLRLPVYNDDNDDAEPERELERCAAREEKIVRYKKLLGLTEAPWDKG